MTATTYSGPIAASLAGITYRQLMDLLPVQVAAKIVEGDLPHGHEILGPCWLWTAATGAGGYGLLTLRQEPLRAHRLTYLTAGGAIPSGLVLDHLCERKLCVRPKHLEPVTDAENIRRHYAGKATCKNGHPWTPENTYRSPGRGRRECRACNRERQARLYWKRKARQ
jgi:hypothetical protein